MSASLQANKKRAATGGCQCGAVRYRIDAALSNAHLCHCRMCQKAAGNYFMPLANVQKKDFAVTRGEIAWFHSSSLVRRGFCRDCGTPLIFDGIGIAHLNVTLGSLDAPASVKPVINVGVEAKMPWFEEIAALPTETSDAGLDAAELEEIARSSRQHPDRDTDVWPARR